MIKLFWNTQNHITQTANDPNKENVLDFNWGKYHKKNSDKWISFILKKVNYEIIQSEKDINNKDVLIIVDSSVEKKTELYNKLKLICSKIFLIHLGDEPGQVNLDSIYNNCDFVWRTFCSRKYFNNDKISCFPIGYKTGTVLQKYTEKRKYKWAFLGTQHKSSRHDLLYQLSNIKPSYCYKTEKFDAKPIEPKEMSEILSSTKFIPCPNGFVHPETYRLYEALECKCIPIVESTYQYYDRLFPSNPFLKVDKWIEAKVIIEKWTDDQITKKQEECYKWWVAYKIQLLEFITNKIK